MGAADSAPFLSVIVPVYQVADYLDQCLESLLANEVADGVEFVLVDDGSTDGSGEMCDGVARQDQRFVVVHKPNEGLVRARKTGLEVARGRYIGFVDGDDWVEPNMFTKLTSVALETGAEVVGCRLFIERPEDTVVGGGGTIGAGFYSGNDVERYIHPRMLVSEKYGVSGVMPSLSCKIIERKLLERHLKRVPDALRNGEDGACTYPVLMESRSIALLDDALYHYRQHPQQMVRSDPERILDSLAIWIRHLELVAQEFASPLLGKQVVSYSLVKLAELVNSVRRTEGLHAASRVFKRVSDDPVLRKTSSSARVGIVSREACVALKASSRGAWRVATVTYELIRIARAAVRRLRQPLVNSVDGK